MCVSNNISRAIIALFGVSLSGCHPAGAADGTADSTARLRAALLSNQQKLVASDNAANDSYGGAVAVSADGLTAIVGSTYADAGGATDAGAVYVYTLSGGTWGSEQRIVASDAMGSAHFGNAVALSGDGNTLMVGARFADPSGTTDAGAAYVYTRSGGTFGGEQKIVASDMAANELFGQSVALSIDGNTAVIGALGAAPGGLTDAGAAYVYTRAGGTFGGEQKLVASDKAPLDRFSSRVALSGDGNTILVGAYTADPGGTTDAGAAYVYTRSGGTFGSEQKLVASDKSSSDYFGDSVALSGDGNTALIGSSGANLGANADAGAAYVYTRSGGMFGGEQKLVASDNAANDNYGHAAALSLDGNTAVLGAYLADLTGAMDAGAAYVYTRSGGTFGGEQKLVASDPAAGDVFTDSVAVSGNGNTVIVGASSADLTGATNAGAVYIFAKSPNGTACTAATDCASGFCADGFCCDSACGNSDDSDCQACSAAKKQSGMGHGTCGAAKSTVVCRGSAGVCDPPETCDGASTVCPMDVKLSGTVCRSAAGVCDVAEMCDGSSPGCPMDVKRSGTVCRMAAGVCDVAEVCDGSSVDCPKDGKRSGNVCRPAVGVCDMAEMCDGSLDGCPADAKRPAGMQCKAAGGNSTCDPADVCDGVRNLCPATYAPPGTTGPACMAPKSCQLNGICH